MQQENRKPYKVEKRKNSRLVRQPAAEDKMVLRYWY
jgi:hypothetical protein